MLKRRQWAKKEEEDAKLMSELGVSYQVADLPGISSAGKPSRLPTKLSDFPTWWECTDYVFLLRKLNPFAFGPECGPKPEGLGPRPDDLPPPWKKRRPALPSHPWETTKTNE